LSTDRPDWPWWRDAVWLTPFYASPQRDHGYDVCDHRSIEQMFGTLDDFDTMLAAAHRRGLRVLIDIVANHSSSQHPWFGQAVASGPGSAERNRYLLRDGRGESGELPPNNWPSVFGGPTWTRIADGQWYLHIFDSSQPDFDWRNPEVHQVYRRWNAVLAEYPRSASGLVCIANCGDDDVHVADLGTPAVLSGGLSADGRLRPDTAAWFSR